MNPNIVSICPSVSVLFHYYSSIDAFCFLVLYILVASRENIKGPIYPRRFVLKSSCPWEGLEVIKVIILYLFAKNSIQVNERKWNVQGSSDLGEGKGGTLRLACSDWSLGGGEGCLWVDRMSVSPISVSAEGYWTFLPQRSCHLEAL